MAWTATKTWAVGYTVTASDMNTYVSDNDDYLKSKADAYDTHDGQNAITAHGSLGAHGASEHTDVTVKVWRPPEYNVFNGMNGYIPRSNIGQGSYTSFSWLVPEDYVSLTSVEVIFDAIPSGGSPTMDWTAYGEQIAEGEADGTDTDTTTENGLSLTGNIRTDLDISAAFDGLTLVANDLMGGKFAIDATSDVTSVQVYGFIVTYVANQ